MTITRNSAKGLSDNVAGGIYNFGHADDTQAAPRLRDVIVADNAAPRGANCAGAIVSSGHNLDSGRTCRFDAAGNLSNTDPNLGPLAENGGPTPTHALRRGSPAIDRGSNGGGKHSTYQRRRPRRLDGDGDGTIVCDIGAFEFDPSQIPTTP